MPRLSPCLALCWNKLPQIIPARSIAHRMSDCLGRLRVDRAWQTPTPPSETLRPPTLLVAPMIARNEMRTPHSGRGSELSWTHSYETIVSRTSPRSSRAPRRRRPRIRLSDTTARVASATFRLIRVRGVNHYPAAGKSPAVAVAVAEHNAERVGACQIRVHVNRHCELHNLTVSRPADPGGSGKSGLISI